MLPPFNCRRDVDYSMGNVVNDIKIDGYGPGGGLRQWGTTVYMIFWTLCCTSEANTEWGERKLK